MASIKGVSRSASVALAPDAPYMAAGTMAGAVDLSFSSSASLEIFKLDFQSEDWELPLVGESPSSERFNRLSWGKATAGSASEKFSLGLIAGGLVDGTIDIWNPLGLIRPEGNENALVGHLSRHKGPVRGLEFNTITPNLLASGADDGEICIWDLANPAEPSHFPPLRSGSSTAQGEISCLSWNSKVQHVLASTSYNGTTVVWDLKKQKPVISFSDPVRRRCSVLQWNPDFATHLVVASDEDNSPSVRLWDVRNVMSPLKEFTGHTKGVIAMAWCPIDSSYLITCAKDSRTICWDTVSGEIVCELPAGNNWNFDVHWYPKIPGVISASSFDGKVGFYNVEGCSRYGVGENVFGAGPLRAPKWYKRPVGASFGFGGKLMWFCPRSSPAGVPAGGSEVYVHNLVTEDSLVGRSSEFEAAIQNGERSLLRVLCDKKSQESEAEDDRETWSFLKVMFEDDGTARTKLLGHLGFSVPTNEKESVQDALSQEVNALGLEDVVPEKVGSGDDKEATIFPTDNGEDFFNNIPSPKADTPLSTSHDNFAIPDAVDGLEQLQQEPDGVGESVDPAFNDGVQRALIVGDYKGAVAQCISANKMADALVIAHVGGASLWESTRDQYFRMSHSPYLKVVSAMVNNDLLSIVNTRPLKFWKETLALLCSFAQREEWTVLCDTLASKLLNAGNTLAATLCYICAGNIDKTVEIWSRSLQTEHEGKSYVDLLQDLMEKTIVLALATGQKRFSASLCKLVEKYAEILASQGLLTTAMEYLKLLGSDELSPELVILRDRIALSTVPEKEVVENSQAPSAAVYGADQSNFGLVDASQSYYQGTTNPGYQPIPSGTGPAAPVTSHLGSVPGHKMPQMIAPSPPQKGFMPVNSGLVQRPGMGSLQPPSPTRAALAQPTVTPAAPPPTVQTVDTSNVPVHQKPVIATLTRLFNETSEALGGLRANPAKKREIEDNSRKLGALFAKLNSGDISKNAADKLVQLCQALDNGDFSTALQIQVLLTTSEWDECNFWLATLKRMIKTRQNVRLS
ncbi:hypothetical protein I3843_14G006100 [Carya illinoinensis]|uniref:Sec16 Sec23-binding domain-containing protein n=1 Tax=Carya illinoinensis TaxID=32201 RepID=A0A922A8H8_CARIL|nr:hypothetical protein I3842_14G006000 [Carya illinoinensis]KAG7945780.1 hypothetical protein I3843_14G006100 [Carya illinoinensis]